MTELQQELQCRHCSLPVPADRKDDGFCCSACAQIFKLIHDEGFESYYNLAEGQSRGQPAPLRDEEESRRDDVWNDPGFLDVYSLSEGNARRIKIVLTGLYCSACVWLIEKGLGRESGVLAARVDFSRSILDLTWNPDKTDLKHLIVRLRNFGYDAAPFRSGSSSNARRKLERSLLIRLGVAGAGTGNVMLFAIPAYFGAFQGMDAEFASLFRWVSFFLTIPVVTYAAWPFHRSAFQGLRQRMLSIDLPVSLGIAVTFLASVWGTITGSDHVFFDSVNMLVLLLLASRVVVATGTRKAQEAADALVSLGIRSARVLREGGYREVALEDVMVGDLAEVLPGDTVPVDGEIVEGSSDLDQSMLTGESLPEPVVKGDRVYAGARNGVSPFVIRATAVGESTRMAQIGRLAQEAAAGKAKIQNLTDRVAGYFVLGVFTAIAAASYYWWHTDPDQILPVAVSLAVILCPCALALGTPFALAAALGRGARRGVMIRNGSALEKLAGVKSVVFDKTGTLTQGIPDITAWELADQGRFVAANSVEQKRKLEEIQNLVAAVESRSRHPVARAIARSVPQPWPEVSKVVELPGWGVQGQVAGKSITIKKSVKDSWIEVHMEGAEAARFSWNDPIRKEAQDVVKSLRDLGLELYLCSGDHPERVAEVAEQLMPITWKGGVEPEGKLEQVRLLQKKGTVLMVGDGTNDVAALAAADVGFAISGGAQVALATGDMYATNPGLGPLRYAIYEGRRTMRVIYRNLSFSLLYNVAGGVAAACGWVSPLVAAVLMPASSLTVLLSSFIVKAMPRDSS